jgi:pimeloyl-ACP methyl ester carboxylesterase/DNA-binding CsgD family transcriptional regulator
VLNRVEVSVAEELRARLTEGRPSQAVLDSFHAIEASAIREPEALAAALEDAARLDLSQALSTLIPARALGVAVSSGEGRVLWRNPAFSTWFGGDGDTAAFQRLLRLAMKGGPVSGLVEAMDGAVLATCVGGAESAARWPLPPEALALLGAGSNRFALVAFAPSRVSDLAARATQAFGLTPLESRLAEALLDAPSIEVAADRAGVGRETARDAIRSAQRKAGVRRSSDLVREMLDMMCGDQPEVTDLTGVFVNAFGASPGEARTGAALARGLTAKEVAAELGVTEHTIRGQLKALYAKSGVGKARDLMRLAAEASTLDAMTRVGETAAQLEGVAGRLRITARPDGRRVAAWDYGPMSGTPVLVGHGTITGRTLPPAFVAALHKRGFRPIVPQRPGFGLTDPSRDDYLGTAAGDLDALLDALRIKSAHILMRDDGAASALAFAATFPDRVISGMLANPRWPGDGVRSPDSLMGSITKAFLIRPEIVSVFGEMLRRQTRSDLLADMIRRSAAHVEADRQVLSRPGVLASMVRDVQAMAARSSQGFAAEQSFYAKGWTPPAVTGDGPWLVMECAPLTLPGVEAAFGALPRVRFADLAGAGLLFYHSHPDQVADIFANHARQEASR